MSTPTRISHLPRRDGQLPEGAKYVGRPSRWGNPHKIGDDGFTPVAGVTATGESLGVFLRLSQLKTVGDVLSAYRATAHMRISRDPNWLAPLRDATALACACPLDMPCHVDVLIELLEVTA
jgi:hypothetical protein